jgi:hypothetical protein
MVLLDQMSREIRNLSIGQLVKYCPEDFKDSTDAQIEMGEAAPFKDAPIDNVKLVHDKITGERWGFTDRYHVHACEDSPEVKRIKEIIQWRSAQRVKNRPEV